MSAPHDGQVGDARKRREEEERVVELLARAKAATSALARTQAAVLALADEWDKEGEDASAGDAHGYACLYHAQDARAACSDTSALDRAKAEAWDEGYEDGHAHARAVNPEWPDAPTNPYREGSQS